jgi:hypothetical protein
MSAVSNIQDGASFLYHHCFVGNRRKIGELLLIAQGLYYKRNRTLLVPHKVTRYENQVFIDITSVWTEILTSETEPIPAVASILNEVCALATKSNTHVDWDQYSHLNDEKDLDSIETLEAWFNENWSNNFDRWKQLKEKAELAAQDLNARIASGELVCE